MIIINASDTKRWGEVSRNVQREIVEVRSHGRTDAFILSPEEFKEYQRLKHQEIQNRLDRALELSEKGKYSTATPEDIVRQAKERYGL
jgi:shikimate kinase